MTKFFKEISIGAPKEKVWKAMANLGDINKFHPGTSNSYYSSTKKEGIGAARVCVLRPAGVVEETVVQWTEGTGFTLEIIPVKNAPPVKNMSATLRLIRVNDTATNVKIEMEYGTKLGIVGNILNALVIEKQMNKGIELLLQGLKVHLEQGHEITDAKRLYQLKLA